MDNDVCSIFPMCTALHCTVLYCTVLYCTALYCTALYCTVLYWPTEIERPRGIYVNTSILLFASVTSLLQLRFITPSRSPGVSDMKLIFAAARACKYYCIYAIRCQDTLHLIYCSCIASHFNPIYFLLIPYH